MLAPWLLAPKGLTLIVSRSPAFIDVPWEYFVGTWRLYT